MIGVGVSLRASLAAGKFSPRALFALSEPGVWYDPSDLTTMFQDRAGTTLVTTPGQSVGLVLDKRLGLTPGPELVTNGTFDTDLSGWTLGTDPTAVIATWDNGRVSIARGAGGITGFSQNVGAVAGRTYEVSFTLISGLVSIGGGFPGFTTVTQIGLNSRKIVATGPDLQVWTSNNSTAVLDNISVREIPGNHMVATADASRGTYGIEPFGGRRNLLTFTEQFNNPAWSTLSAAVTANSAVDPIGGTSADLLIPGISAVNWVFSSQINTGSVTSISVFAKYSGKTWMTQSNSTGFVRYASFNLLTGEVGTVANNYTAIMESVGNGWYRCVVTTPTGFNERAIFAVSDTDGGIGAARNGSDGILLWGAQLEVGSTATHYQRVTTAFDVTEAGVPTVHYVQFDGADDGYLTSTITPGTDKVQVFAGVRKLSDAATGMLVELSANALSGSGSFYITAPELAADAYKFLPRGTGNGGVIGVPLASYPAPITNLLTALADRSPASSIIRLDGTQVAQSTASQGTGNYLAYPLYVGRRGGTSLPFNGRLYQMVVRFGPNLDAARIAQVERFINSKTGAY